MYSRTQRSLGLLMFALVESASGQFPGFGPAAFAQLTATDDGSQFYFTSTLLLKSGSSPITAPEGRLYGLGPGGPVLVAERGSRAITVGLEGIERPQVSGDGSTLTFTMRDFCPLVPTNPAVICTPITAQAIAQGKPQPELGRGYVELSRNGRWALLTPIVDFTRQTATLVDLNTGQRTTVPAGPVEGAVPTLASDGTVLVEERGENGEGTHKFGLWKQGVVTPISRDPDDLRATALSDNARVLVLGAHDRDATKLAARDMRTGRRTVIFSSPNRTEVGVFLGMSNDGTHVLYMKAPIGAPPTGPAFLANTSTGESQPVRVPVGESIVTGTLSGSGNFAFLVTTANHLVKVSTATGEITTLLPATPYSPFVHGLVAGSLHRLKGSLGGTVEDWTGKILLDGKAVPVLAGGTGEILIQVPWEQRLGAVPLRLDRANDSPFQQARTAEVVRLFPHPVAVIRGDWSGVLERPPASGEIVHLYLTGLGPVSPWAQTGVPPSALHALDGIIKCGFNGIEGLSPTSAETLWAGLAPGLVGVYQVSIRLPNVAGAWGDVLVCNVKLATAESTLIHGMGLIPR